MEKKCTAILLAAGKGSRMQSRTKKQFLDLCGTTVLSYSLKCFERSHYIDDIVIVSDQDDIRVCQEMVQDLKCAKVSGIVSGGEQRYDSVYMGLCACRPDTDFVLIHDGARPFVTEDMIMRTLEAAFETGAGVAGMPAKDTVKLVDSLGNVELTPDRKKIWLVQTPQTFRFTKIKEAYDAMMRTDEKAGITDDAMVAERAGMKVRMVEGSYRNIKLTTPEDLVIAEAFVWQGSRKEKNKNND